MIDDPLVPWKCDSCGRELMVAPDLPVSCSCSSVTGIRLPAVGSILKQHIPMKFVSWVIAKMKKKCLCKTIEEKMNRLGPSGCKASLDELVSDLRKSAETAGMGMIFSESLVRGWLASAINQAEEELEKTKRLLKSK